MILTKRFTFILRYDDDKIVLDDTEIADKMIATLHPTLIKVLAASIESVRDNSDTKPSG